MIFPPNFASLVIGIFIFFTTFASAATRLPPDEVEALKEIGKTLGKNWDFSVGADPCTTWRTGYDKELGFENNVNCTCNAAVCHITRISLKAQNLPGTLPPELARLTELQDIDLSRNYLSGTIPPEWGSMKLVYISLLGNRLTGPIPNELGNISTLESLTVQFNQLSGPIPPELGNLTRLWKLHLTSNNFSGELPEELARLTTMKDFWIGDNQFTGKIPDFIQKWVNLEKLVIQGSGLDGPIPPGIALLTQLTDLRISDLNASQEQPFPHLNNLTSLKTLILRSCNINGTLPKYLEKMTNLKTLLDLSFNKLKGEIPSNFSYIPSKDIYLTGNLLSGRVPNWMLDDERNVDLSYNNFDFNLDSRFQYCQRGKMNLFGSSSKGNFSGNLPCMTLRSFRCEKNRSSFHINCGGKEVSLDGKRYEADTDPGGRSYFYETETKWMFSSTGSFLDQNTTDDFISTNSPSLSMKNSELYKDARISPISLTYYGFCLENGNYNINLHFAEIMFNGSKTYSSLGRRIFHIYIQGRMVQKDFNIVDEAGGIGKEIIKNYAANVTNGTLEIRFYWAGKGTTGLPVRGVYGPLISAISVYNPDYEHTKGISAGAVVGIVAAVAFVIILLLGIFWWRGFLIRKDTREQDLKGLDLQTGSFTLRQIKAATNNFDEANKIGEGGFGSVYKGLLSDGTLIAVKQLSSKSKQGNREFVNEIGMISALQHPHLVKLYGCCIEGNQLLLVYEYMENNSLARALFGPEECQLQLDWPTRYKICIGIARGLAYLHEESRLKIVHRDIKATNVLLDENLNAKISDFGLAKLDEEDDTHISTRIAGTYGYMAPEYAMHGYLTDKADVYSFGIVALEIVSGRSNTSNRTKKYCLYLLDWALVLKQKGDLMELVDPKLGSDFNKTEVTVMINIALLCTNVLPAVRPAMSSVVSMLEGRTACEPPVPDPGASNEQMNLKGIFALQKSLETGTSEGQIQLQKSLETDTSEGQIQLVSTDAPYTASSTSAGDLYPFNLDSDILINRN